MKIFRRLMAVCAIGILLNTSSAADQPQSNKFPIPIWYALEEQPARHLESMIAEFEAGNRHYDIQGRNFKNSEELYSALESGEKPIFAIVEASQLKALDKSTDLTPVEDWMPREQFLFSWSVKHDVYGPLFQASSVDGRLMARPFFYSTTALIYDLEMLQAKGLKSAPLTWAELDAATELLRDEENGVWGFAFEDAEDIEEGLDLIKGQLAGVLAEGGQEAVLNFILKLGQDWAKTVALPGDIDQGKQIAMRTGTVADYLRLRQQGLTVRTAGVPGPDEKNRRTDFKVWSVGMFPVESGDLYKAQEFAFWLLDFEQQRNWAENTPYLSAHVKVFDNPFYRQARSEEHNDLRVFVNLLNRADLVEAKEDHEKTLMATLSSVFPQLLRGELDIASALKMFAVHSPEEVKMEQSGASTEFHLAPEATEEIAR